MQESRIKSFLTSHVSLLTSRTSGCAAAISLSLCLLTACNTPPAVNPWRDDSISPVTWTTPSEQGILAAGHEPHIRQRDFAPADAALVCGEVPHYPLWWEDPFEDKGDEDGRFAWTWQDYFAMPYSYARMHLNTVAWPVSAIVTLPGTPMVSDGYVAPNRDHDARRGLAPNPSASPLDFGYDEGAGVPHSADPVIEEPLPADDLAYPAGPPTTAPGI